MEKPEALAGAVEQPFAALCWAAAVLFFVRNARDDLKGGFT